MLIQSISDVITNSSSEVFCTITGSDEVLNKISEILKAVIPDDYYWEEDPHLRMRNKENFVEDGWYSAEDVAEYPERWIEVVLPYSVAHCSDFYKAGIEALLKVNNIKDYNIEYERDS